MAVLSDDEIQSRLANAEGWERDGDALRKVFKFDDFAASVEFVNRISEPAEEMNHHPDHARSWDTVTGTLSTHSEGGITESDFELASKIDPLA